MYRYCILEKIHNTTKPKNIISILNTKHWLTGTVSRNFRHFFSSSKSFKWAPYECLFIWVSRIFCFREDNVLTKICKKNMCPHSHWLCWHSVSVVDDYDDMMSAWLLTMRTQCLCGQRLCRQSVSVVINYNDTRPKKFYSGKRKK